MIQQFLAMIDKKIETKDSIFGQRALVEGLQELRSDVEKMDSGWIQVTERKPEDNTFVLVVSTKGVVDKAWHSIVFDESHFFRDGDELNVAHWQPLPPTPIK